MTEERWLVLLVTVCGVTGGLLAWTVVAAAAGLYPWWPVPVAALLVAATVVVLPRLTPQPPPGTGRHAERRP